MKSRFNFPTRILFGEQSLEDLPQELSSMGSKRPLVVTDRGLVNTPIPEMVSAVIQDAGMETETFSQVSPNPTDAQVDEGARVFADYGADCIVAVGGGSPMDAGKAIQIRINHHEAMEEYDDLKGGDTKITGQLPPLVAIPTTAGTGSEVSRSAVISVAAAGRKVILFSPRLMPSVAICDPTLTYGLPARITAETGMDALSHNVEAYLSKGYHPMADGIALKAISMVARNLLTATKDGKNVEARRQMMMASTMGAVAFQKGLGVIHSLAHPLSSVSGLSHGLANALMMPHALAFNSQVVPGRVADIAVALGSKDHSAQGAIDVVEELLSKLGLKARLTEVGVKESQIDDLVKNAMTDGCHTTNPRQCTDEDMRSLFKAAW